MSTETATRQIHPAYIRLCDMTRPQLHRLAHALAIEADWHYHDGPEWAAQYWAAFSDLAETQTQTLSAGLRRRALERTGWTPLTAEQSGQARAIFRALLACLHPDVVPHAQYDARALLWRKVLRAYRGGDLDALTALLRETRRLGIACRLPAAVVALRAEHDRLRHRGEDADRRLAELSQQFPFPLRNRLADADWIRRQRLALRQAKAMATPPPALQMREQVS